MATQFIQLHNGMRVEVETDESNQREAMRGGGQQIAGGVSKLGVSFDEQVKPRICAP